MFIHNRIGEDLEAPASSCHLIFRGGRSIGGGSGSICLGDRTVRAKVFSALQNLKAFTAKDRSPIRQVEYLDNGIIDIREIEVEINHIHVVLDGIEGSSQRSVS